jgi:hypothetical protein
MLARAARHCDAMSAEKDRDPARSQATEPAGVVFLSYSSQDVEAARGICDALRAAGIAIAATARHHCAEAMISILTAIRASARHAVPCTTAERAVVAAHP